MRKIKQLVSLAFCALLAMSVWAEDFTPTDIANLKVSVPETAEVYQFSDTTCTIQKSGEDVGQCEYTYVKDGALGMITLIFADNTRNYVDLTFTSLTAGTGKYFEAPGGSGQAFTFTVVGSNYAPEDVVWRTMTVTEDGETEDYVFFVDTVEVDENVYPYTYTKNGASEARVDLDTESSVLTFTTANSGTIITTYIGDHVETNTFTISAALQPDLKVKAFGIYETNVVTEGSVWIDLDIENDGAVDALNEFITKVYIGTTDNVASMTEVQFGLDYGASGSHSVYGLAAGASQTLVYGTDSAASEGIQYGLSLGASSSVQCGIDIPASHSLSAFSAPSVPGTYYLAARVDANDTNSESNEDNNWSEVQTLIVDPGYAPVCSIQGRTMTVTEDGETEDYVFSVDTVEVDGTENSYSYTRTGASKASVVLTNESSVLESSVLTFKTANSGTIVTTHEGGHVETNTFTLGAVPTWSISKTSAQHTGAGGDGSFIIRQTSGAPATWETESKTDWISMIDSSGTNDVTIEYFVFANTTGVSRAGSLVAGGNTLTVYQAAMKDFAPTNISQCVLSINEKYETKKYAFSTESNFVSVAVTDNNGDVAFGTNGTYSYSKSNGENGSVEIDSLWWTLTFTSKTEGEAVTYDPENYTETTLPFILTSGDWAPESLVGKLAVGTDENATSFRDKGSFVCEEDDEDGDDKGTYTYTKTAAITGLATQWFEGDPTNVTETVKLTMFSATQGVYEVAEAGKNGVFTIEDGALYWLEVKDGEGTGAYAQNDAVEIEATNVAHKAFVAWMGAVAYVESTIAAETTVTMPAEDITVYATHTDTPWDVVGNLYTNVDGAASSHSFVVTNTSSTTAKWSATIEPSDATNWLSLAESYTNMTNAASVVFSVTSNETGRVREGIILVAGKEFDVDQAPLAPLAATNPSPEHNDGTGEAVNRNVTLKWENGGRALSYNVYFAQTNQTLKKVEAEFKASSTEAGATNTYQIGTRAPGRRCTWRVDAVNEGGTNTGSVWAFLPKNVATVDESLDADGLNLEGTTSTNVAPWFSTIVTNGIKTNTVMQSGAITNGQETAIETTIQGPGTLSFDVKVSTDGTNALNFVVNEDILINWVDDIDWTNRTAELKKGEQVVKWVYAQNNDTTISNAAWLDEVSWSGENKTTYPFNCGDVYTAAYLWSDADQTWLELGVEEDRSEIVLENLQQGNWYWFCVLEWKLDVSLPEGGEWVLIHGDWFRQLDD